jgi:hypothetical protein
VSIKWESRGRDYFGSMQRPRRPTIAIARTRPSSPPKIKTASPGGYEKVNLKMSESSATWLLYQKYCTVCAVLAMLSLIVGTFVLSTEGRSYLDVLTGNDCAARYQNTSAGQQPYQRINENDYEACRLAVHTRNLVIFTVLLVAVTAGLVLVGIWHAGHVRDSAKATERLATATQRNVDLVLEIERPYVSGGGVKALMMVSPGLFGLSGEFEIHINNHGKTPALLQYIEYGYCDASNPPLPITFGTPIPLKDSIGPGTQSRPLRRVPLQYVYTNPAIYARFHYSDIWGNKRHSTWVHRIDWPEGQVGGIPIDAPAPYRECT